jgi:hypothetical protein
MKLMQAIRTMNKWVYVFLAVALALGILSHIENEKEFNDFYDWQLEQELKKKP